MPDNLGSMKVFAEGGLNTNRDVLSQGERSPGSAINLINYEPAITGGYRRISGYSNDYGTVPGTAKVLGVAVSDGINDGVLAARKPSSGNNYLHYWDNSAENWVAVTTSGSPTMTGVKKVRFTKYNWSGEKVLLTDGVNPAATYDGTTYTQVTHAQAPTTPAHSAVFKRHVFFAGNSSDPYNLYFSAPLDETNFNPDDGAGVINIGFPIVAIKPFRDQLYIFGTTNIRRLVGNNISDWSVQNVTDDLGCLATDSVVELAGDLLFLSQDGLRPISGTNKIGDVNLESMTKNIQSIFTNIVFDIDLDGLSTVIIRQKSQIRFFFASADSQGIIGGFRENQQGGLNFEFGQLLGIEPTCADSGYLGQYEFVIHGESDGKVYRQEQGNSFGGTDIFSTFQTPYYYMEDPEQRKIFYDVSTYLRSEGDTEIILSVGFDYGDNNTPISTNYNLTTEKAAAFYNEAIYDSTAIFDGNPSPVRKTNISGSGKSVSFTYVTNGQTASHSIQGMVVTYGVGDRR
tara:strand:- start:111 stop:1652 length:1542 start_codon:yes stop_codon:yes gene_type:complete